MSKQLDSILKNVPPATASYTSRSQVEPPKDVASEETDRIVAVVPKRLKEEIRDHIRANKGETERTVILRALKSLGFTVKDEWLVDKRTTR